MLVKNFRKTKKFDPTFIPDPYKIVEMDDKAKKLVLKSEDGSRIIRHPDKVKPHLEMDKLNESDTERDVELYDDTWESRFQMESVNIPEEESEEVLDEMEDGETATGPRRSSRIRNANPKYKEFVMN